MSWLYVFADPYLLVGPKLALSWPHVGPMLNPMLVSLYCRCLGSMYSPILTYLLALSWPHVESDASFPVLPVSWRHVFIDHCPLVGPTLVSPYIHSIQKSRLFHEHAFFGYLTTNIYLRLLQNTRTDPYTPKTSNFWRFWVPKTSHFAKKYPNSW